MLAGHFGVSDTLKAKEKHASLGLLFLAVGFADLLWSLFIILGREQAQIVPTLPSSRLNLYYMPFDHSLVGILFWSIVIYVLFRFLPVPHGARKSAIALVMAVAVFSHFVLDIPVHRADLGLIGNMYKIGFGLYNYPLPAFLLEAACLLGGLWLYLRATTGTTFLGKYGMILLAVLLLLINALTYWGQTRRASRKSPCFCPQSISCRHCWPIGWMGSVARKQSAFLKQFNQRHRYDQKG